MIPNKFIHDTLKNSSIFSRYLGIIDTVLFVLLFCKQKVPLNLLQMISKLFINVYFCFLVFSCFDINFQFRNNFFSLASRKRKVGRYMLFYVASAIFQPFATKIKSFPNLKD